MNEFFGIDMTHIMIGLLVVLAIALGSVAYVFARNRIMFMVGVRNIPRRRAQTVLIVIGLMLSTLIITAALGIGDTVDYSITNQAYSRLHNIDEIVQAGSVDDSEDPFDDATIIAAEPMTQEEADDILGRIKQIDGVDGAVQVLRAPAPAESATQAEPVTLLIGLDGSSLEGFDDIESLSGEKLAIGDLARDEFYVDESMADKLDVQAGDTVTISVSGREITFTVKEIVKDRLLAGAAPGLPEGAVMGLERAQELFGRDTVDFIAVSNDGGVRDGLGLSESVTDAINAELRTSGFAANDTKQTAVDIANETSSFMTTFVTVLGLFSIAAGMMLIFLIFVMLAAERKVEMGMVRAVGTKRSHLVQMFMSEGMVYNVGAAFVGVLLGIAVSALLMRMMAQLLEAFDLAITFHITWRSLVIAYSIGVVLTFLTVTFSSWRVGVLNIVSAIRDLPDPAPHRVKPSWRNVFSFVLWVLFRARRWRDWGVSIGMIVVGVALGIGAILGIFGAGRSPLDPGAVAAVYDEGSTIRGVLGVLIAICGGFAVAGGFALALFGLSRIFQLGALGIVLGLPLMVLGVFSEQAAPYAGGTTLLLLGIASTLVSMGFNARAVLTSVGLTLLVFWLLTAGERIPPNGLSGGPEMFFLSGVSMVLCATFVLVYNADIMLAGVTLLGGRMSWLVPSIRTAVAYPLANRFRTGMTIAMISLVMFALVMMSTMNSNFDRIFLSDDALAGYDVAVSENPNNRIGDLQTELARKDADISGIAGVDDLDHPNAGVDQARLLDDEEFSGATIYGLTDSFIENNEIKFQARAFGYENDRAVWDAIAADPQYAVIDSWSVSGGDFDNEDLVIDSISNTDKVFEPVKVEIRDDISGRQRQVTIIGVVDLKPSYLFSGLMVSPQRFADVFGEPESSLHYVRLNDGENPRDAAREIERTLLRQGVQAESLRKIIDDDLALSRGFLYLIQGFMGLGLFVGIAAVGVIAFRTVVERRQQIGMLRAIGYSRRAVALSLLMESSFTALLGIVSGIGLGLLLAQQLVQTDDFVPGGVDSFYIPWLQIIGIGAFAFLASIVMTIIPSRQASGIPIAEALRYE
jgi:putative ABC transport system permease protein